MPGATTVLALPYPLAAEPNNVPADLLALANRLDAVPGIEALTTTTRDALPAAKRPTGRVIWNITNARLEEYNGAAWVRVPVAGDVKVRVAHTWQIPTVNVPSGTTDFLMGFPVEVPTGAAATLVALRHLLWNGTSATFKFSRSAAGTGAYVDLATGIVASGTYTRTTTGLPVALTDGDILRPTITAVSGSPLNLFLAAIVEYALV